MENESKYEALKKEIKQIVNFIKNPENKDFFKNIKFILRLIQPNNVWRILGDILIFLICIISIIYCADKGYIKSDNIQSLLTLVIGAIIGARFKSS